MVKDRNETIGALPIKIHVCFKLPSRSSSLMLATHGGQDFC
jgi:hypothetical protein